MCIPHNSSISIKSANSLPHLFGTYTICTTSSENMSVCLSCVSFHLWTPHEEVTARAKLRDQQKKLRNLSHIFLLNREAKLWNSAQMEGRRSTDCLRLVINPLGSVHPLLEMAGAAGDALKKLWHPANTVSWDFSYPGSWPPSLKVQNYVFLGSQQKSTTPSIL